MSKSETRVEDVPDITANGKSPVILPYHNGDVKTIERVSTVSIRLNDILSNLLWKCLLVVGVLLYGSFGVLVHLCEENGKLPFSSFSLNLVIEIMKFCISVTMLLITMRGVTSITIPSIRYILALSVPAVLYTINNNVAVHLQLQMDPTTYQVLGNMKTVTTAFLYRIIMKRQLNAEKWFSIAMLVFAGVLDSYGGYLPSRQAPSLAGESSIAIGSLIYVTRRGILMLVPYCFISGFAGVYTEYVLKSHFHHPLHLQNAILYMFGIILNFCTWMSQAQSRSFDYNLFRGFSSFTWVIVATQAVSGLITSAVMKHSSNITRLFIISCAMLVATVLSVLVFHTQLSYHFFIAATLVVSAIALYHRT